MHKSLLSSLLILFVLISTLTAQRRIITNGGVKYLSNQIIIMLDENSSGKHLNKLQRTTDLRQALDEYGIGEMTKRFDLPEDENNTSAKKLNKIYTLSFDTAEDPVQLSRKVANLPGVEWAEPCYVREAFYTPSDTLSTEAIQWGLYKIQAQQAWDLDKGNPDVVIAIVDTGIYWDHPDLRENIWQNLGEDADGDGRTMEFVNDAWVMDPGDINYEDDDGNGYADDLLGWDFQGWNGEPDNDPVEDTPTHGTHVAGIASAVTDNVYGIASIGFNCSLMAVKTSQYEVGSGYIINGHEGIVYAAANGAKAINCSWGGPGYSMAEKAAVDYALSKGALVVSSAGNTSNQLKNYPASYDGVLAVGRTNQYDRIDASCYGTTVDVMAPGTTILSTWCSIIQGDRTSSFSLKSGTSMASPLVAGLAGLVFSHFPGYSPEQVLEQIRVNCEDIYSINSATVYQYKLGKGRVNAYNALNNTNSVAVRASDVQFIEVGASNGRLESGETVIVRVNFVNYLSANSGVTVTMVTDNTNVTITNPSFTTGAMNIMSSVSNAGNEFRFTINNNAPFDETIDFRLDYSGGTYQDFQWLTVDINSTYSTVATGNLATTITSNGSIGFNDYPDNTQGNGLIFLRGANILWEGAFMYGTSATSVMDAARINNNDKSSDFKLITPVQVVPGTFADEESYSFFNDDGAGAGKLGIETELRTYSFGPAPDNNYIIFRYILKNKSGADISGLHAGMFFDLDLDETDWDGDIVNYDQTDNFGYMYDQNGYPTDIYVGASLLSSTDYGFYGIRSDGNDSNVNLSTSFTKAAKWYTMTHGTSHSSVLSAQDVAFVVSGGPYSIPNNESINVAFVVAAGSDLDDLRASIQQSRTKWNGVSTDVDDYELTLPDEFSLSQNYPNPFNPSTTINYNIPNLAVGTSHDLFVKLKIYDILGRVVTTLVNETQPAGTYNVAFNAGNLPAGKAGLPSGIYFYQLQAGAFTQTRKMIFLK